jgi:phage gpG-like protein
MNLDDLPAYLQRLRDAAASAVVPAANALAEGVRDRMVNVTLRETTHPPGVFWKAVMDRPPAYASGNLARSIRVTPAFGAVRASAGVGASARYAALQEWGGRTWPNSAEYMHWRNPRPWWKKIVTVPEHPFFRPTVEGMIRDGSLNRLAADAFYDRVSPLFRGGA